MIVFIPFPNNQATPQTFHSRILADKADGWAEQSPAVDSLGLGGVQP